MLPVTESLRQSKRSQVFGFRNHAPAHRERAFPETQQTVPNVRTVPPVVAKITSFSGMAALFASDVFSDSTNVMQLHKPTGALLAHSLWLTLNPYDFTPSWKICRQDI